MFSDKYFGCVKLDNMMMRWEKKFQQLKTISSTRISLIEISEL